MIGVTKIHRRFAFAVLASALALLSGCERPTHDQSLLAAIKAEARMLLLVHPTGASTTVPKRQWPYAIASLEPEHVTVYPDGVDISTKPYFDGGWGYFVSRDEREPPEPAGRFSKLGQGIYWYHPY